MKPSKCPAKEKNGSRIRKKRTGRRRENVELLCHLKTPKNYLDYSSCTCQNFGR